MHKNLKPETKFNPYWGSGFSRGADKYVEVIRLSAVQYQTWLIDLGGFGWPLFCAATVEKRA